MSADDRTPAQLALDVEMGPNDSNATTVRGYLVALVTAVWIEGEGFSGKRPFGNSGWEMDLVPPLVHAGLVNAELDPEGYVSWMTDADQKAYRSLILDAIRELGVTA